MTGPVGSARPSRAAVRDAVEAGRDRILGLQDGAGCWRAGQPTQVEITAEYLLFRHCAGLWDADVAAATARWLRAQQCLSGGWPAREGGPQDHTTSVLAYCALRLAGDSPDAYQMAMAAGWIRDAGGLAIAGVRARVWLALLGEADWHELRIPPPEAIYLPEAHSARVTGAVGWGRPTVVPLTVLGALRPVRCLPFGLSELRVPAADGTATRSVRPGGLDRPQLRGPARSAALRKCTAWILAAQQPDGSWRADGPGWLYSLLALHLLGTSWSDPAVASGLAALDATAFWTEAPSGPVRRMDLGSRAVQPTADAVLALSEAGLPAGHDALLAAGRWLLGQELKARAAWLAGRRDPSDGAGAADGLRADASDTASVILALRRVSLAAQTGQRRAIACSIRWLASVQGRDGGWSGDTDTRSRASARLTGEVLSALAAAGQPGSAPIRRAAVCLLRLQLADGSWPEDEDARLPGVAPPAGLPPGRPAGTVAGRLDATSAVLGALVAAGVQPAKAQLHRAARWLAQAQNRDGGWGSAADGPPGSSDSDPLSTARVLLALLAVGGSETAETIDRGVAWLARAQLEDGSWREAGPDPGRDPARVSSTPVRALARYLSSPTAGGSVPAARQAQDAQIPAVAHDLSR
jgi:squalene-hopene/tetraprenyl-beta-curcumene cyclase